jgi:hypothetical protein
VPINGPDLLSVLSGRASAPAGESRLNKFIPDDHPRQMPVHSIVHSRGNIRAVYYSVVFEEFCVCCGVLYYSGIPSRGVSGVGNTTGIAEAAGEDSSTATRQ